MFLKPIIYSSATTLLLVIIGIFFHQNLTIETNDLAILLGVFWIINIGLSFWVLNYYLINTSSKLVWHSKDQELIALKKAEKYRREFFGNVSHELKTPVFNIQGYVETLIDGALYDKSVNKKYLKRTSKSVDRLIHILQDLESIAQLDSEQISLDIKEWNLSNLVDEIIDQFEIKASKKQIQLINKKESINFNVLADKDKISQVLYNLISNSIKYGKHKGTTTISCHQSAKQCFITVKDDGIGIAENNIKRLFERFYRVDKSRSREQGGTGLGLAIVKHIIEAHNQSIHVKSIIEKGTQFTFSIHCLKCSKG